MRKVFLTVPSTMSRAMFRVESALRMFKPPSVRIVDREEDADLVLLHAIGYPETEEAIARVRARGKLTAIAQYCFRTTQRPTARDWVPLWSRASLVWSYYDLPHAVAAEQPEALDNINFLITPLGVDPIFQPLERAKDFVILTSGYVAESEGVREAQFAAQAVGRDVIHLGPMNVFGTQPPKNVVFAFGVSDGELRECYSRSEFVAGLRRGEGFEMPAAEGLLCGARPIMFDQPHYRRWFDGLAEFIPELGPSAVALHLETKFKQRARPVEPSERAEAAGRFSWPEIARQFWEAVSEV